MTFNFVIFFFSKVEVKYKPLSFWAKKVQEIEAENPVKKKCQLYELSDSDESCSPELSKSYFLSLSVLYSKFFFFSLFWSILA